jgi:hypothetical protein
MPCPYGLRSFNKTKKRAFGPERGMLSSCN